ncbi:MAG: preprotein translocase subunit YajC [Luteolibacter sp.]|uniref:preprotein translocase subunit YajC n=1 Tax=Luteolibacter sp. TaxID=1962973 RepID=UPI0032634173
MIPIHAFIANFLAADTTAAASGPAGLLGNPMIMMGLMVIMFYFLLIRPQQVQRKEMAARIASLQTGDRVITTSGIHGIVHNVKEHTVIVKVSEGTMLEFDKPAIASVKKKDAA